MLSPKELGQIVKTRRTELGFTQRKVVDRVADQLGTEAISEPTYRAVETGRTNASALTLSAVSRALDWPPDALERIRDGAPPPNAADAASAGDEIQIAALAGNLTPENRAKLEGYARALLDDQERP
ncbi:MAG: helix-turn-helix transcriptional regulator [Acidimicrobiia bacterium]|nr:helix-turn-helix transcriptional regulator [Acidimicrobiia bacterium]